MNTSNQLELFENEINSSTSLQKLEIEYVKDFFNKTESDILFDLLKKEIEWKQDFIVMYGKSHPLPRLTAWYGDKNKRYTYSGITMKPLSWTRELLKIRRKLEVFSQQEFNSVLLNYYRSGSRDRIEPLNIGQQTSVTLNQENQRRDAIAKSFHIDQLLVQANRTMTATEVLQRNEEKMRILGPALSRLQSELLQPMILRVFNIMLRNKLFLQAPEILANQEIDIEYVSPMALAQKGQELQSLMRGLELFGQIGQIAPVQDYIDEEGLIKQIIRITGLPARMIKSDKEVQMIREQRAAQQQQQMQMMQAMQEAKVAKDAAPMVKELNNVGQ